MAVAIGQKVNTSAPDLPRHCSRQSSRNNTSADSPEVYYKRVISIPFLDELIAHLQSCFSDIQQKAMTSMRLVPSVLMDKSLQSSSIDQLKEYC